jgi:clan AA aspartic protease (TIGR02281 family)
VPVFCIIMTCPVFARADTIRLKNGNSVVGIITNEGKDSVEMELDAGTVQFKKKELQAIDRTTTPEEASALRNQWEEQRQEQKRKQQQLDAQARQEQGVRDNLSWDANWVTLRVPDNSLQRSSRSAGETGLRVQAENKPRQEQKPLYRTPGSQVIKLKGDRTGRLIATVWINETTPLQMVIDTGASLVSFTQKAGEKLYSTGALPRTPLIRPVQTIVADGRKVLETSVTIRSIRLESMVAQNVEASIALAKEATPLECDGLLGMSFLGKFNFGINRKEGTLTLEKLQ